MRISARDLVKQLPKRGGFQPDALRDHGVMFSTVQSKDGKTYYIFLKIGKELVMTAGLEAGDDVNLEWDTESGEGWLNVVPAGEGWKLVSGNPKTDTPPLVLRMTWRDSKDKPMPSIAQPALCKVLSARGRRLAFIFPKGVSFGPMALEREGVKEGEDELYAQHEQIMEREQEIYKKKPNQAINKKAPRKAAPPKTPQRRASDKVPEWRDERPYGRRRGDYD